MAVQATETVLRIFYQPFLSSTRTKQLTSILNSALPYEFVPAPDTTLSNIDPVDHDIILISRGGKPFAPVWQRDNIDSITYGSLSERDWKRSGEQYKLAMYAWEEGLQARLSKTVRRLRRYFSNQAVKRGDFKGANVIKIALQKQGHPREANRLFPLIQRFRELRSAQFRLYPMLKATDAFAKEFAREEFSLTHLTSKEMLIENQRDQFDEVRMLLEKRYKGMGLVKSYGQEEIKQGEAVQVIQSEDTVGAQPWVLVPEDPVGVWADSFPDEVDKLIQLANRRFLMDEEESADELEIEAMEMLEDRRHEIRRQLAESGEEFSERDIIESLKGQLKSEQQRLWSGDDIGIKIPYYVGARMDAFSTPKTREDIAAYRLAERSLKARSAWRVED